jgi:superfamily II DNA or RNA helicase
LVNATLFPDDNDRNTLRLRPYQDQAVGQILEALKHSSSCLAVLATGTGKTEIAASLIKSYAMDGALMLSPLIELTGQTANRLRARGVPCGIEQGALRSSEDVTVACYASMLSRKRYEQYLLKTRLLIVDEVHLNFTRRALQMLGYFREAGCKIVGLTASPDRGRGDPLTKWYGGCAYEYGYRRALEDGWLVPAKLWLTVLEDLDLSSFTSKFGDFDGEKLARLMQREKTVQSVANMIAQHYEEQPSVVFCQSIQQSEMLREVLDRMGVASAIVHSQMESDERRMHLNDFEQGNCHVILNVGVLTLGWDWPPVRKLFIAKPTRSKSRYIQMFGRGTRALPGVVDGWGTAEQRKKAITESAKPFFEVFDITDTSRHNDLQTAIDVVSPELGRKLLKRVRQASENSTVALDIDPIVEAERKALAAEEAALDALETDKKRGMVTQARFGVYGRDVFAAAETPDRKRRQWHMLFGKHKGTPLRDVPTPYLRWVMEESNCRNRSFMDAVSKEVKSRR